MTRDPLQSPKLTWKPFGSPFRGTVVFIGPFLGFHVSFRECRFTVCIYGVFIKELMHNLNVI